MQKFVLRELLIDSKDGEWGKGESTDGLVEMLVIRGTDFEAVRIGQIDNIPKRFILDRIASRKKLTSQDIIIETAGGSKDRTTGRTLILKDRFFNRVRLPVTCASFARFLRIDQAKANPAYIFWLLQAMYESRQLARYHTQHTGVARYQFTTFADNEPLYLPNITIQRRIASILSTYDNNTRRIAILEEMARRIYEEWFVKFKFPGHEKIKMVDSELGKIPEGWKVKAVPDAIDINPATKLQKDGLKPFIPMNCLSDNSMVITGHEMREGNSGSKFKNGDTLFARITPCLENGKTGFVQFLPNEATIAFGSTEFIMLRSKSLSSEIVYLLSRTNSFRDNAIKSMSGATGRQRVKESCFDSYLFAHPNKEIILSFTELVSPMFKEIFVLQRKNANLRTTRDFLLPKLISGEIDVSSLLEPEEAAA